MLMKYKFIKLPASLLDVDTRLQSLLSIYSIPASRQLTASSYSLGLWPELQVKYQDDNHLKLYQRNRLIDNSFSSCLAM